jgi:hypothetical protein
MQEQAQEFDAAVQQVRLLGGPEVVGALEEFLVRFAGLERPISVSAWDYAERGLIDAMRAEQDADLLADPRSPSSARTPTV